MFDAATTRKDFSSLKEIITDVLLAVPDEAWLRQTGDRDTDWTLHQLMAHLVSIAQVFQQAADAAATDTELSFRSMTQREDLAAWNQREIERLGQSPPNALSIRLRQLLDKSVMQAHQYTDEQLQKTVLLPVYNRPAPAMHFIDWQLSHLGIIHAAQLVRPLGMAPLWTRYPNEMLPRMVDRYMRHFSYAYWQAYGSGHTVINFHVGDAGEWHLIAAEDGGDSGIGAADNADYAVHFDSPATLFGIFTRYLPIKTAMQSGALRFSHDWRAVMAVLMLFRASPPQ